MNISLKSDADPAIYNHDGCSIEGDLNQWFQFKRKRAAPLMEPPINQVVQHYFFWVLPSTFCKTCISVLG